MTTQDMLKQAVNDLRQAAQLRKAEVDDMRKELAYQDQQEKDRINTLRQQEALRLTEAGRADDDRTSANKAREAQMLQVQESQTKATMEKIKKDTDNLISIKQRNIDDINQMANSIEQNWYNL